LNIQSPEYYTTHKIKGYKPGHLPFVTCTSSGKFISILGYILSSSSSSPFTACGAQDIHEDLPGIAISSYSLNLIP
jgi:hypothetical protein